MQRIRPFSSSKHQLPAVDRTALTAVSAAAGSAGSHARAADQATRSSSSRAVPSYCWTRVFRVAADRPPAFRTGVVRLRGAERGDGLADRLDEGREVDLLVVRTEGNGLARRQCSDVMAQFRLIGQLGAVDQDGEDDQAPLQGERDLRADPVALVVEVADARRVRERSPLLAHDREEDVALPQVPFDLVGEVGALGDGALVAEHLVLAERVLECRVEVRADAIGVGTAEVDEDGGGHVVLVSERGSAPGVLKRAVGAPAGRSPRAARDGASGAGRGSARGGSERRIRWVKPRVELGG